MAGREKAVLDRDPDNLGTVANGKEDRGDSFAIDDNATVLDARRGRCSDRRLARYGAAGRR